MCRKITNFAPISFKIIETDGKSEGRKTRAGDRV